MIFEILPEWLNVVIVIVPFVVLIVLGVLFGVRESYDDKTSDWCL